MPFTYVFDPAARIVRTLGHGLIRFDDIAAHLQALVDAGLAHVPQLIDSRAAEHDLSMSDMRRLAELVGKVPAAEGAPRRTALVVTIMVDYGMARMYGGLSAETDSGFAVFQDLAEAEAWLTGAS